MGQRPQFDMSRLTTADKLVFAGSGLFCIWAFVPTWYKYTSESLFGVAVPGAGSASVNAWRGVTFIAALLSLIALVWAGLRVAGVNLNLNVKPGLVDLGLAGLALLITLLGLIAEPAGSGISWGIFVGLILALVWAYGTYMKFNEPA